MIRLRDISLPAREDSRAALLRAAARELRVREGDILEMKLRRRSVDARRRGDVRILYTLDVRTAAEDAAVLKNVGPKASAAEEYTYSPPAESRLSSRPVIAGFGPAGMFAGLILAYAGARPIIFERGRDVDARVRDVERFWGTGALDPASNVQFGEGGAGAFSDGKLNTGIKDPRIRWVLERFVEFGAEESVAYDAKPHVGTDRLRTVVKNLRERIISLGGEVRFESALTGIRIRGGRVAGVTVNGAEEIVCDSLILAVGHSARDTFEYLHALGVPMEPKPFAMGVRAEHSQAALNKYRFGSFAGLKSLGAADYKLVCHTSAGSAYTF